MEQAHASSCLWIARMCLLPLIAVASAITQTEISENRASSGCGWDNVVNFQRKSKQALEAMTISERGSENSVRKAWRTEGERELTARTLKPYALSGAAPVGIELSPCSVKRAGIPAGVLPIRLVHVCSDHPPLASVTKP